jgi:hypothetical protein
MGGYSKDLLAVFAGVLRNLSVAELETFWDRVVQLGNSRAEIEMIEAELDRRELRRHAGRSLL